MKQYIVALDQGTTSSRCIIFDKGQHVIGMAQKEYTQLYPQPGWVEHDPMEIYSSQYGVLMEVLAQTGITPEEIAAVGITNQRETTILWDKATGRPVYNAIVWQCRRTAKLCEQIKEDPDLTAYIKEKTGLLVDAYFLRHQDQVDFGSCARRSGKGQTGRGAVRHGGQLACLEAHRWKGAYHGLYQRLPHHAV